jgi:DNA-binding CsgD family transcriptional regulator
VAELRAAGKSHRQIAGVLGCAERTVRYDLAELRRRAEHTNPTA